MISEFYTEHKNINKLKEFIRDEIPNSKYVYTPYIINNKYKISL